MSDQTSSPSNLVHKKKEGNQGSHCLGSSSNSPDNDACYMLKLADN